MNNEIEKLIKELYELDPGLRADEERLVKILENLMISRPDTGFSKEFASQLKKQLLEKKEVPQGKENETMWGFDIRKLNYVFGGVALVAVAIAIVFAVGPQNKGGIFSSSGDLSKLLSASITAVGDRAFGEISLSQQNAEATGLGGGGGSPKDESVARMAPGYGGGGLGMPNPYAVKYEFVYEGENLELSQQQLNVLKRIKGEQLRPALNQVFSSTDLGLIDLGSFSSPKVENINFMEGRDRGYSVNVSFGEGSISLYQNYNGPESECQDQKCFDDLRLSIDDLPSDQQVADAATRFLNDHGIDMSGYGEPEVNSDWLRVYKANPEQSEMYVPNILTVVFPQILEGKKVYDQSGRPMGLAVGVWARDLSISGAWNILTRQYESSSYQAITDFDKLVSIAEQGGIYFYQTDYQAEKTVQVKLGTPSQAVVQVYNYHNGGGSSELYVPVLVFPVTEEVQEGYFYRDAVIVPLVEGVIQDYDYPVRIMPAEEPVLESKPTPTDQ